jgi:hypothetical protein
MIDTGFIGALVDTENVDCLLLLVSPFRVLVVVCPPTPDIIIGMCKNNHELADRNAQTPLLGEPHC